MSKPIVLIDGKSHQLYKRGSAPDAPWWFRIQAKGVRRSASTGTSDDEQAVKRAERMIREAIAGRWKEVDSMRVDAPKPSYPWPTLRRIFAVAKSLNVKSMNLYQSAAITLAAEGLGKTKTEVLQMPVSIFTAPLVRAFQARRQNLEKANPATILPGNGTANSIVTNARGLFSAKALAHYERAGLAVPDMAPFKSVPLLDVESERYSDNPIPDKVLREIDVLLPLAPLDVATAHKAIRLDGTPPGKLDQSAALKHARWLSKWKITPRRLHHHAAAAMRRKTGSVEVTARWCQLSPQVVEWHTSKLSAPVANLTLEETYLGL